LVNRVKVNIGQPPRHCRKGAWWWATLWNVFCR